MLVARRVAAAMAFLPVAGALLVLTFSMADAAAAPADGCASPAEVTVLPSPLAPWNGAPLRVMVVSEKPVDGVLSLIAPDGSVAAKSLRSARRAAFFLVRRSRSPRGRHLARDAAARSWVGGLQSDQPRDPGERPQAGAVACAGGTDLAGAQRLEQHQRSAVLGLDRKAVRRTARSGSELEGLVRGAARSLAQFPA